MLSKSVEIVVSRPVGMFLLGARWFFSCLHGHDIAFAEMGVEAQWRACQFNSGGAVLVVSIKAEYCASVSPCSDHLLAQSGVCVVDDLACKHATFSCYVGTGLPLG